MEKIIRMSRVKNYTLPSVKEQLNALQKRKKSGIVITSIGIAFNPYRTNVENRVSS